MDHRCLLVYFIQLCVVITNGYSELHEHLLLNNNHVWRSSSSSSSSSLKSDLQQSSNIYDDVGKKKSRISLLQSSRDIIWPLFIQLPSTTHDDVGTRKKSHTSLLPSSSSSSSSRNKILWPRFEQPPSTPSKSDLQQPSVHAVGKSRTPPGDILPLDKMHSLPESADILQGIPYPYADEDLYMRRRSGIYPKLPGGATPVKQSHANTQADGKNGFVINGRLEVRPGHADQARKAARAAERPGKEPRLRAPPCPSFPFCHFWPRPPSVNPPPPLPPYLREHAPDYRLGQVGKTDWYSPKIGLHVTPTPPRAAGPPYPQGEHEPKAWFGHPKKPKPVEANPAFGHRTKKKGLSAHPARPTGIAGVYENGDEWNTKPAPPPDKPNYLLDTPSGEKLHNVTKELYQLWQYGDSPRPGHAKDKIMTVLHPGGAAGGKHAQTYVQPKGGKFDDSLFGSATEAGSGTDLDNLFGARRAIDDDLFGSK